MNFAHDFWRATRNLINHPVLQHFQREHRRQIKELLDDLQIDTDATIFDLAIEKPEKIIELAEHLKQMESDGAGRPEGSGTDYDRRHEIATAAFEARARGVPNWQQRVCDKYGVSKSTMYEYINEFYPKNK